jgi:hypothetical protein
MLIQERMMVRLEGLIQVIFEELDPVWLKSMWDEDGDTRNSMIEIIHLLYLIKTMPWISMFIMTFRLGL